MINKVVDPEINGITVAANVFVLALVSALLIVTVRFILAGG